jgi:hypothetical protein
MRGNSQIYYGKINVLKQLVWKRVIRWFQIIFHYAISHVWTETATKHLTAS